MLNTEINEFSAQANLTQVASYFNIVDNAVKTGDTNKKYTFSTNACNAPSAPIRKGGWTSVIISPTCDNMVDLYNSYITAQMKVQIKGLGCSTIPERCKAPRIWIGFKDSLQAISQYQILANGQSIYTQSNAIEEAYITDLATPESVKKVDVFSKARHKDIWNPRYAAKCGAFIDLVSGGENTTYSTTIDLKIDLRRFLPLSSIRMLPAFVGNIELRLKFSTDGMVIAPSNILYSVPDYDLRAKINIIDGNAGDLECKFVPINETFNYINNLNSENNKINYSTTEGQTQIMDMEITSCRSHLACFGLDDNLYQGLVQRYTNESLSFPIQTLTFNGMNGHIDSNNGMVDFTLTSTPRFVDTIFVLFQKNQNYRTCYENPLFDTFQLKMGGYGVIPDLPFSSFGPEFFEMVSNAFNTNNDSAGFNKDVMESLVNNVIVEYNNSIESKDVTNYVMAFPTSTDFTYQQGQTSSTPITYHLQGVLTRDNNGNVYSPLKESNPIALMGFLKDSVLAIQLRPQGPPIISLDEYDITSPAE